MSNERLLIGAFGPFGGKAVNNAELVSKRLQDRHTAGELVDDQVEVHFVPLDCTAEGVQQFVEQARQLAPDKVLMLGESGFRTRIETRAFDRGIPGPILTSTVQEMLSAKGYAGELTSPAPVAEMARQSGSLLSHDAGAYYCNYAYHSALSAGLNAVFVHVPSGLLGMGRSTDHAAQKVEAILDTWYLAP